MGEVDIVAIRVVRPPTGAAPDWVRRAWVGVEIPVLEPRSASHEVVYAIAAPRSRIAHWWAKILGRYKTIEGYAVSSRSALLALAVNQPKAAAWWRKRAPEHMLLGHRLIFDADCCEPVSPAAANDQGPPPPRHKPRRKPRRGRAPK